MTVKAVINNCYGGYALSKKAYEHLGIPWDNYGYAFNEDRLNPRLVACVEKLGKEASGECSQLKVVTVEIDVEVHNKYDGQETVEVNWYCD